MCNHFHLLVEVPQRPEDSEMFDDEGLIAHVLKWQGEGAATKLRWELEFYRSPENDRSDEEMRRARGVGVAACLFIAAGPVADQRSQLGVWLVGIGRIVVEV